MNVRIHTLALVLAVGPPLEDVVPPDPPTVTLRALLTVDGTATEGARIELAMDETIRDAVTSADGVATFDGLPPGAEVELAASGPPFTVRPGTRLRLPAQPEVVDVELRLDGIRSVLATVLDAQTGAPIDHASLAWSGPDGASASDELTHSGGMGFVRVGRGGRVSAVAIGYRAASVEHVGDAAEIAPIRLTRLEPGETGVRVRVLDREGLPIAGVRVHVGGVVRSETGSLVARCSGDGETDERGVVPPIGWRLFSGERLELRIGSGIPIFRRLFTVPWGEVVPIDLFPAQGDGVIVRGVVRLDGGDVAAAGATVTWSSELWTQKIGLDRTVSAEDGSFALTVAPGPGFLEARLTDRGSAVRIDVGREGNEGVVLDLEAGPEVSIEARDAITGRTVHRQRLFALRFGERRVIVRPHGFAAATVVVTAADVLQTVVVGLVRESG